MAKLVRAGADRVVNPQLMGGRRMAAFALQPHVADFLDVVMHDDELDYRLEQIEIGAHSLQGLTLRDSRCPGAQARFCSPCARRTAASWRTPIRQRRSGPARCSSGWAPRLSSPARGRGPEPRVDRPPGRP